MKVGDLASDLEVPPSAVIEQCQRLGIDATWAGADLTAAQQTLIRVELAGEGSEAAAVRSPALAASPGAAPRPPEVAPSPDGATPVPGRATPTAATLPPTAVGSLPDLAGALADEADDRAEADGHHHGPSFAGGPSGAREAGGRVSTQVVDGTTGRLVTSPAQRRTDPAVRPALIALVLAVAVLIGADQLGNAAIIAALWVVAFGALVTAALASNRARYRITTHPDQRAGLPVAAAVLVVSLLGLLGLGTAVWVAARDAPAASAPLGLGDLRSVAHLRWGILRLGALSDTGWERPAKDAGTCWKAARPDADPRREERSEVGGERVSCTSIHAHEVLAVFAVDRDADSPYPGEDELRATGIARCRPAVADIGTAPADLRIDVEYPTSDGWENGDHDVACVATTARKGPLG